MNIEFIKCFGDGSWEKEIIDVPEDVMTTEGMVVDQDESYTKKVPIPFTSPEWDSAVIGWCWEVLSEQPKYKDVVYWGIFSSEPNAKKVPELIITRDLSPLNPRTEFSNLGTMVCFHPLILGDEHHHHIEDWDFGMVPEGSVIMPIYLLDHSGVTIRCGQPFSDFWDSGQVGWIYASPAKMDEFLGGHDEDSREAAERLLKLEVGRCNAYLNGDVWGYKFGEDSCWGFIGETLQETGLEVRLPKEALPQLQKAWDERERRPA